MAWDKKEVLQFINEDTYCVKQLAGIGSKAITIDRVFNLESAMELVRDIVNRLNEGTL